MCYDGYMQTEFLIMLTDISACMQDAYDAHTQCNVRLVTSLSGRYGYADSPLPKLQLFTDLALPTLNSGQFMIIFIAHRTFPESCYVRLRVLQLCILQDPLLRRYQWKLALAYKFMCVKFHRNLFTFVKMAPSVLDISPAIPSIAVQSKTMNIKRCRITSTVQNATKCI